jgi:hypothetical protein
MARRFAVQHFVACASVAVVQAGVNNPYTLRDVVYAYLVPADQEWPVRLADLWLFSRFFHGIGTREFAVQVVWLDGPSGAEEVCEFRGIMVQFPAGEPVHSRAWRVAAVRYPGPGRYAFRLRDGRTGRVLSREYIELRKQP